MRYSTCATGSFLAVLTVMAVCTSSASAYGGRSNAYPTASTGSGLVSPKNLVRDESTSPALSPIVGAVTRTYDETADPQTPSAQEAKQAVTGKKEQETISRQIARNENATSQPPRREMRTRADKKAAATAAASREPEPTPPGDLRGFTISGGGTVMRENAQTVSISQPAMRPPAGPLEPILMEGYAETISPAPGVRMPLEPVISSNYQEALPAAQPVPTPEVVEPTRREPTTASMALEPIIMNSQSAAPSVEAPKQPMPVITSPQSHTMPVFDVPVFNVPPLKAYSPLTIETTTQPLAPIISPGTDQRPTQAQFEITPQRVPLSQPSVRQRTDTAQPLDGSILTTPRIGSPRSRGDLPPLVGKY